MNDDKKKLIKDMVFAFQLGSQVIGSFLIAVVGGLYLDDLFHTKPFIILIFLLLAFIYVISLLLKAGK